MGQVPRRSTILSVSIGYPCVITTTEAHGYTSFQFVRLTNLNGCMPHPHGCDQLNGYRFRIVVLGDDTFKLQDPITFVDIDSTNFPPYTEGGNCNLIEHNYIYYNDGNNNG